MAKIGVELSIDVTKIDKAKLYKGKKGTYLSVTAFIDTEQLDQYGNSGMLTQKVSKEEQEQGVKGATLGNSKVFWKDSGNAPQQNQGYSSQNPAPGFQKAGMTVGGNSAIDEDVPF